MKVSDTYKIIERIVNETPVTSFEKTLRGVQLKELEFIFATDKHVIEDQSLVIVSKNDTHYLPYCPKIRNKLLTIYDTCVRVVNE